MEAAEEQEQCMERSTSGNVRPTASTEPAKRPTQIASHVGISMGTPGVVALVHDVTDPEATISENLDRSEEDTTGSPANTGEPIARRQRRMDWQEKSRFPSKQQWQASFASGDQFVVHTTRHTTKGFVKQLRCIYGRKPGWHNFLYQLQVEFLENGRWWSIGMGRSMTTSKFCPCKQPH